MSRIVDTELENKLMTTLELDKKPLVTTNMKGGEIHIKFEEQTEADNKKSYISLAEKSYKIYPYNESKRKRLKTSHRHTIFK